jgi:hypothetical protein
VGHVPAVQSLHGFCNNSNGINNLFILGLTASLLPLDRASFISLFMDGENGKKNCFSAHLLEFQDSAVPFVWNKLGCLQKRSGF